MVAASPDRDLVFGILAVQNGFVGPGEFLKIANDHLRDGSDPLGDGLLHCRVITEEEHKVLNALTDVHLSRHQNPVKNVLAALNVDSQVRYQILALNPDYQDVDETVGGPPLSKADARTSADVGKRSTVTGRFRILGLHARGGLGEVMLAKDAELNRHVAVKHIRHEFSHDRGCRSRFEQEAAITGRLEHPGIVPIYGMGRYADGTPFYAMRFIAGKSLKKAIDEFHSSEARDATLSPGNAKFRDLLNRLIDVCNAVQYAHDNNILHRDIKPSNIMLGEYGETLVVDWGLAKFLGQAEPIGDPVEAGTNAAHATRQGARIGTPGYMSPEQAAGDLDLLGPATDIYSLGATLYEILTGQPTVSSKQRETGTFQDSNQTCPSPKNMNRRVPTGLDAICRKAMAIDPADRFQSATDLADDIGRWLAGESVRAWQEPWRLRVLRRMRKHPRIVIGVTIGGLVGLMALSALSIMLQHQLQLKRQAMIGNARQRGDFARVLEVIGEVKYPSIQLRLHRVEALDALLLSEDRDRELEELVALKSKGEQQGLIRLWEGDLMLLREKEARDSVSLAIELGLPSDEDAFARSILAETTPDSLRWLNKTLEINRFHVRAMRQLVLNLTLSARYEEAEKWLHIAEFIYPDDKTFKLVGAVEAMFAERGSAKAISESLRGFLSDHDFDLVQQALLDVELFRRTDPSSPEAAVLRKQILDRVIDKLIEIKSAESDLTSVLETIRATPPFFKAYASLLNPLLKEGLVTLTDGLVSVPELRAAADMHPDAVFHFLLGQQLAHKDPPPLRQIEQAYQRASGLPSTIRGTSANVLLALAEVRFRIFQQEQDPKALAGALESLRQRLHLAPTLRADQAEHVLQICEVAEDFGLCRVLMEQQIQARPEGRMKWLEHLCRIELTAGDHLRALRISDEALAFNPDAVWAHRQRAEALHQLGRVLEEANPR